MNWKTFNNMSEERQREYLFLFEKKPELRISADAFLIFSLMLYFLLMLSITYLISTGDNNFTELEEYIPTFVQGMSKLIQLMMFIVIINIVISVIKYVYYYIKLFWWVRKNNIKKQKDYFWRKDPNEL